MDSIIDRINNPEEIPEDLDFDFFWNLQEPRM